MAVGYSVGYSGSVTSSRARARARARGRGLWLGLGLGHILPHPTTYHIHPG